MGTAHLLEFHSSVTAPPPLPPSMGLLLITPYNYPSRHLTNFGGFSTKIRCCATGQGGRTGSSRWDSNAEKTVREERFRFNLDDRDVKQDEGEGGDGYEFFRGGAKKRVWWSDDSWDIDDDDDEEGFGVLEDSIDMSWFFKVLNAFGWMVPAVVISMLLGTGSNAFFMALVLPLAQSAVSLATDTIWGRRTNGSPKSKRRTKKKPFSRAASNVGMSEEREDTKTSKMRENYQSWEAANVSSTKRGDKKQSPGFGGWDELDERARSYGKVPKRTPSQNANEASQQKKGKLSRMRYREKPLLLRLLVAVFPFLGSWTKLL